MPSLADAYVESWAGCSLFRDVFHHCISHSYYYCFPYFCSVGDGWNAVLYMLDQCFDTKLYLNSLVILASRENFINNDYQLLQSICLE